jgi:hypothetical protein
LQWQNYIFFLLISLAYRIAFSWVACCLFSQRHYCLSKKMHVCVCFGKHHKLSGIIMLVIVCKGKHSVNSFQLWVIWFISKISVLFIYRTGPNTGKENLIGLSSLVFSFSWQHKKLFEYFSHLPLNRMSNFHDFLCRYVTLLLNGQIAQRKLHFRKKMKRPVLHLQIAIYD